MNLSDEQKFAIRWCYSRANDYVEEHSPTKNPYEHYTGPLDLIVGKYNLTQIIKDLLNEQQRFSTTTTLSNQ